MTLSVVRKPPKEALAQLERVVIEGDLGILSDNDRIGYYARVCESLGLNPLTRPFEYIRLNGKLTLYARKDATDQLRKINGVSVERLERERDADLDLAIVTAYGRDRSGRTDSSIGAVSTKGLHGEAMANALMKAETKAKRRLTLSLAGLGWLDESEADGSLTATVSVDPVTGAIETTEAEERQAALRDRIAERTAALQGRPNDPVESEGAEVDGAADPGFQPGGGDDTPSSGGSPARAGDAWMRRLHAVGTERGMDHDALHDWATEHFRVRSLKDLTPPQRATFMELLERMPVIAQPGESAPSPADSPEAGSSVPASGSSPAASDPPTEPSAAPTDAELLAAAGEGAEILPPKKGTPEYDALPSGVERAKATAYWSKQAKQEPEQESLAEALGAPKS